MIWFTADQHFGHANIIRYCDRPFKDVTEMDEQLIKRWNDVVGHSDTVYHLGDFTLGDTSVARNYFAQLNGRVIILYTAWHHDKRWIKDFAGLSTRNAYVKTLSPLDTIKLNEHNITLCHYPLAEWDRKHYGAWHLHGHSHGKYWGEGHIWDVGVDRNDFTPMSFESIVQNEHFALEEN